MTRREFLNNLYRRLGNLSREQAEQYLTYYAEMLADRMEEGMSEAEAVASMEDVEAIAQRIAQDEGVAPTYPDLFPTSGAADEEEPLPQPRRDWRKPAQIALWAAAIVAVIFAVGKQIAGVGFGSGARQTTSTTAVDYATEEALPDFNSGEWFWEEDEIALDGIHVGPDGIWYSGEDGRFYMGPDGIWLDDIPAAQDYSSTGPLYEVPAEGLETVIVNWVSGLVEVQSWSGDTVRFQEDSGGHGTIDSDFGNGTLEITGGGGDTRLKLLIPEGRVDLVEISGGATDVVCAKLWVNALSVETTSGDIVLSNLAGAELEVYSTSGDVVGAGVMDQWTVRTTSGDIDLFPHDFYELDLNTTSGDMELALSDEAFSLEYTTVSGDLDSDFPLTLRGGFYAYENGGKFIRVNTTSGDLTLTEQ